MAFLPKYGSVDRVVAFDPSIDDYKFELNTFEVVVQTHHPPASRRRWSLRKFARERTRLLQGPSATEMRTALLIMIFVAAGSPGSAAGSLG
jgi:hypothetical protein